MNRTSSMLLSAVFLLGAVACDKKSETSSTTGSTTSTQTTSQANADVKAAAGSGGCLQTEAGMCIQYGTLSTSEVADEKKDCVKEKGKWLASCPTENLLGTCTNRQKGEGLQMKLYKSAAFSTAAEAKKALCSDSGDQFAPAAK